LICTSTTSMTARLWLDPDLVVGTSVRPAGDW
jgi:hypothetical protein